MTSASTVTRVAPEDFDWAATSGTAEDVRRVTSAATDEDFIDLGETTAFTPEVMDGECAT